jgi:2-iminobutanoate/2-iminopropanoate deaminase
MKKQIIKTEKAPSSPLYSQGVKVGSTIYVSGMVGMDAESKQMVGTTIQEQTRQALRNCKAIVEAGGGRLEDVVQVTVLLTNPADFAGMNEEYAKVFATEPPARAVTRLGVELPNVLVSIMMTARVESI